MSDFSLPKDWDTEHRYALQSIQRNASVPSCPHDLLQRAARAGLCLFVAWPAGHWSLTDAGREYLQASENESCA